MPVPLHPPWRHLRHGCWLWSLTVLTTVGSSGIPNILALGRDWGSDRGRILALVVSSAHLPFLSGASLSLFAGQIYHFHSGPWPACSTHHTPYLECLPSCAISDSDPSSVPDSDLSIFRPRALGTFLGATSSVFHASLIFQSSWLLCQTAGIRRAAPLSHHLYFPGTQHWAWPRERTIDVC